MWTGCTINPPPRPSETATDAVGMHRTGMHSCIKTVTKVAGGKIKPSHKDPRRMSSRISNLLKVSCCLNFALFM